MKKNEMIDLILRILVGGLFAVSGYMKLIEPSANFIGAILSYEIVTASTASFIAYTMPWAELILGVFLILGLWRPLSVYGLWLMNILFIAAIASALYRKLPIKDCGCFGEGARAWPIQWTLALDIVLCAAFFYLRPKQKV